MVTFQHRWGSIRAVAFRYPTVLWVFGIAAVYLALVVWLNQLSLVLPTMRAAQPLYTYASVGLILLIALMLGINLTLLTHELHRRWVLRHSITATGGVIAGIIGSACPACAVGLFPLFSGFFGVSRLKSRVVWYLRVFVTGL